MLKSITLCIVCFFTLLACSAHKESDSSSAYQEWMKANGKLKVLSTIAMIDDLIRQVGGSYVDTMVLIKGELDPHSYQLVKGDDEKLAFADLIFYNGLGLEHGPSLQSFLQSHSKAIPLGNQLLSKESKLVLTYKGQVDPHIWMDISLWAKTVPFIVSQLSLKDPEHAKEYEMNGQNLFAKLLEHHQEILAKLHAIPASKRYLVTSHDAFTYFARAYLSEPNEDVDKWKARVAAPEGLAPESQIGAADIQLLIDHLQKYHIQVLFPESNVSRDSIRKIMQAAKEKGIKIKIADTYLYADAMGKLGTDGDSYVKMMLHNSKAIAENIKYNGAHD